MPRKTKANPEEKVQIVEIYLRGEIGIKSAATKSGVVPSTIEQWVALYKAEGPSGFIQTERNRCYPPEVKKLSCDSQGTAVVFDTVAEAVSSVRASMPLAAAWSKKIDADYNNRKKK